jgi:integrase
MAVTKLTARSVENADAPDKGRIEIWDTLVRGLGLRITDKGAKSWVVMYRVDGRLRRYTLGAYPTMNLSAAREQGREALIAVGKGRDPADEKIKARRAPRNAPDTVDRIVDQFIARYAKPKNRSWQETERIFRRYVIPAWGKLPITEITRRDIIALLDPIVERAPYMANRVHASVRRLFNWCLERDLITISPAANVKPPGVETSRDRILTDDEVRTLWATWNEVGYPFGAVFKLLLVTGQRREEVAQMRWEEVDLDKALWTLPREQTKSDRLHEVPLSPLALDILDAVPRTSDYVFTTTGTTPISGFSKAKIRSDKLSGVTGWRIHDLRRTFASGMARIGVPPHVVEKVLNHANGQISGVAAIYNRHGYTDEKRGALDAWARNIGNLVGSGAVQGLRDRSVVQ